MTCFPASPDARSPDTRIRSRDFSFIIAFLTLLFITGICARASEYQWSVPMDPAIPDPSCHPRAFLWIPPTCQRVRAVLLGQHDMIEEGIFDDPCFRQAMAQLGFAIVWVTPSFDPLVPFDQGAGDRVNALMKALARDSGYGEIELLGRPQYRRPARPDDHGPANTAAPLLQNSSRLSPLLKS